MHWVDDHQLDRLTDEPPTRLILDMIKGAAGIALGLAIPVTKNFDQSYWRLNSTPLSAWELAEIVLFFGSLVALVICWILLAKSPPDPRLRLKNDIRERQDKKRVSGFRC